MDSKVLDKLKERKSCSAEELGSLLADLANGVMSGKHKQIAEHIATKEHRYLQQELFNLLCWMIDAYAAQEKLGRYDARNKWACKLAKDLKKTKDEFVLS